LNHCSLFQVHLAFDVQDAGIVNDDKPHT